MVTTRRNLSALVLTAAIAALAIGVIRALDLGPGSKALTAATSSKHSQHEGASSEGRHEGHKAARRTQPAALENGRYALEVDQQVVPVGARHFTFKVTDAGTGEPVTHFDVEQSKKLHLIVVREDLTGFQHVHPTLDKRGRWTATEAVLGRAGSWRLIADFVPAGGTQTVLSSTVQATGGFYRARPLRESKRAGEHRWQTTLPGFKVTVDARDYVRGKDGRMEFSVRRRGRPAAGLQPYLGAYGHAVLLRRGDVAYTHVHPREGVPRKGKIVFDVAYPRGAPLGLFLQFRHGRKVRTAEFGLPSPPAPSE